MIDALLSLPPLLGCLLFAALTTAIGLVVWLVALRLHERRESEAAKKELSDATNNLFRVVGWLFTLLLSLTFTDVASELNATEAAIDGEAAAISDTHHSLERFGLEETRHIHTLLHAYTRAVIEDEWPALAEDRLSERADALLRQVEDAVMGLEATSGTQEVVRSRIIADLDAVSDYRMARLGMARERPSTVLLVVLFGYLVTMVYFGVYRPRGDLVALVSLYTVFVGVVVYLVLALSDPFLGSMSRDAAPLEYVLEEMTGPSS